MKVTKMSIAGEAMRRAQQREDLTEVMTQSFVPLNKIPNGVYRLKKAALPAVGKIVVAKQGMYIYIHNQSFEDNERNSSVDEGHPNCFRLGAYMPYNAFLELVEDIDLDKYVLLGPPEAQELNTSMFP